VKYISRFSYTGFSWVLDIVDGFRRTTAQHASVAVQHCRLSCVQSMNHGADRITVTCDIFLKTVRCCRIAAETTDIRNNLVKRTLSPHSAFVRPTRESYERAMGTAIGRTTSSTGEKWAQVCSLAWSAHRQNLTAQTDEWTGRSIQQPSQTGSGKNSDKGLELSWIDSGGNVFRAK
jgi:hypothetical protein